MNLKSLLMFAACFSLLTVDGSCMQNNNYSQMRPNWNMNNQQQAQHPRSKDVNKDRKSKNNNMPSNFQQRLPGNQFNPQMPGFIPPGQQFRQQFNQPGQGFQQYGMQQQRPMNSSYTYSNAQIKTTPTTPRQKTGKKQMNNMKPYRSNNIMQNQQFSPSNSAYGMQYQQRKR